MILPIDGAQNSIASGYVPSARRPADSTSSFGQQLAAVLDPPAGQTGNGPASANSGKLFSSQDSGGSQVLVTEKTAVASSDGPGTPLTSALTGGSRSPIVTDRLATSAAGAPADTSASAGDDGGATLNPTDPTTGSGAPAPGYENVPFGSSFTAMPTLATELAEVNRASAMMAQINPDSLSTATGQAGDPMNGATIPGTSMAWNDLTMNQQLAFQHASLAGLPQGASMTQFLTDNVGPSAWWNASYSQPNMFGPPPAAGSVNMHTNGYTGASA